MEKMHPVTKAALKKIEWSKGWNWQAYHVPGGLSAVKGFATRDDARRFVDEQGKGWRAVDVTDGIPDGWHYCDGGRNLAGAFDVWIDGERRIAVIDTVESWQAMAIAAAAIQVYRPGTVLGVFDKAGNAVGTVEQQLDLSAVITLADGGDHADE